MSWDIFVQDLPANAQSVRDIPDDFEPGPLMPRAALLGGILKVVPDANTSDPSWVVIEGPGYSIEINIGDEDPVTSFAFHVRGGDMAVGTVAEILEHFDLRAIDGTTESGFFDRQGSLQSLRHWRDYRDHVSRSVSSE